jgi:HPt (histidine-containing phosphotransfer) domain-containing protein
MGNPSSLKGWMRLGVILQWELTVCTSSFPVSSPPQSCVLFPSGAFRLFRLSRLFNPADRTTTIHTNSARHSHSTTSLKLKPLSKKLTTLCMRSRSIPSPTTVLTISLFTLSNARDLDRLSRKGHFLKGSSAALGLQRVQHSCESMQHFGNRKDEHGEGPLLSEEDALKRCRVLLVRLRKEQDEAKEWLEAFYKA